VGPLDRAGLVPRSTETGRELYTVKAKCGVLNVRTGGIYIYHPALNDKIKKITAQRTIRARGALAIQGAWMSTNAKR
jgi:hypothetical protein